MRNPTLKIRPSSMERSLRCPASLYAEEGELLIVVVYTEGGGPADIGRAAHEVFRAQAEGEEYDLAEVAARYKVKVQDLSYLRWSSAQFVELLQAEFDVETWVAEEHLSSVPVEGSEFVLEGTPDLWGVTADGKMAVLADLKTGRASISNEGQMKSYALMIFTTKPKVETVIALTCWARDLEVQKWAWTREQITAWALETEQRIYGWDGKSYTVGAHCMYCRRQSACPARAVELRAAQEMMLAEVPAGETALSGTDMAKAWEASILIPKVVDGWRERIRERIMATGPIPMDSGKMLDLVERKTAPEIDTVKASAVLKSEFDFSDEEVLSSCKLGKGLAEGVVAGKAGKGRKGAEKKRMTEVLTEKGALISKTTLAFKVVNMVEKLEEG